MDRISKERSEDRFAKKLAAWLGITVAELSEYGEDVIENNGDYGNLKYAYMLPFSKETPTEILDKMGRISKQYIVFFNLEELDG